MKFGSKGNVISALISLMIGAFLFGCTVSGDSSLAPPNTSGITNSPSSTLAPPETEGNAVNGKLTVSFTFTRINSYGTNQFAVWIEDEAGEYVATVAVTKFTATGGYKKRPTSIPKWVSKSGLADMTIQEADAVSGATPKSGEVLYDWDCTYMDGRPVPPGTYRFIVEGTSDYTDNIGRNVIFAGTIEIGNDSMESSAVCEHADEHAEERGMIADVKASFTPYS